MYGNRHLRDPVGVHQCEHGRPFSRCERERKYGWGNPSQIPGCGWRESAWPYYSEDGKAVHMGKGHTVRGRCVVILLNVKAWESLPMSAEHSEP